MVNGSPKANGNTARALAEVSEQLNAEGIDTEVFQLGAKPIRDCIGCGQCGKLGGRCTFDDDVVNEAHRCRRTGRWFCLWLPVYYAHPSGRILSALDRAFYAGGHAFEHKPGAAVAVARRGGTSTTFDVLNKYFTIKQMPVVASTYWNNVFGRVPGDADGDAEGLATMRNIGKNMAGSCAVSRQDRPPVSTHPRQIEQRPTSFDRAAEHEYPDFWNQKVFRYQEGPALFLRSAALRCSLSTLRKRR